MGWRAHLPAVRGYSRWQKCTDDILSTNFLAGRGTIHQRVSITNSRVNRLAVELVVVDAQSAGASD
jgi:hypothetical protein